MESLTDRAHGFLTRKLSESFSFFAFIMCLINFFLIIALAFTCMRRNKRKHYTARNLLQGTGVYAGGEAGNEAAKEATNAYGTINSKLSLVSTYSGSSDNVSLPGPSNSSPEL